MGLAATAPVCTKACNTSSLELAADLCEVGEDVIVGGVSQVLGQVLPGALAGDDGLRANGLRCKYAAYCGMALQRSDTKKCATEPFKYGFNTRMTL